MTKTQYKRSVAAKNAWANKSDEKKKAHIARLHGDRKKWLENKKKWGNDLDFSFNKQGLCISTEISPQSNHA